jgi:hypothetical protein
MALSRKLCCHENAIFFCLFVVVVGVGVTVNNLKLFSVAMQQ